MKKYRVLIREVWIRTCEVEAESPTEAWQCLHDKPELMAEAETDFELSHVASPRTWTVEEIFP